MLVIVVDFPPSIASHDRAHPVCASVKLIRVYVAASS